jgi:hypothetical protein
LGRYFGERKPLKKENILQADVKMARLLPFAKLGILKLFLDNVMSKKTEKQEMKIAAISYLILLRS